MSDVDCCPNFVSTEDDPAEWARTRETEGWPMLGVADHLFLSAAMPHVFTTLTRMALATERVTLMSAFANNMVRSPVEFAQASLSVQQAAGGRFWAGLGAGWARAEVEGAGLRYPERGERAGRFIEAARIVRELFDHGSCTFEGEHYTIDIPTIGPAVEAPKLVASLGGPRTIREIGPVVDAIELKVNSVSTRGGSLDIGALATITRDDLRRLVGRAREAAPDAPLGLFCICATGSSPRVEAMRGALDGAFPGEFLGEPAKVADAIRSLGDEGISWAQLSEFTPGTFEALAADLL
ncbi:MAG: LLM class flavin-dependent oxidoreductase [Actinomycetota bacterium]